MKRTVPLCVIGALMSTTAVAQSSVTLYGRLNLTLERQKVGSTTVNELRNNSSRIGFKGSEDLGDGLKAGFQLEHGFSPDTGVANPVFWGRQSELFLGGGFGTLRLGRFTSEAYYATADYVSMHNHDTGTSSDAFYAYVGRNNDKVAYASPAFGGLTFHASVGLVDPPVGGTDRNVDLAVNWDAGALHLGAGFERGDGNARQFALRALYEMGPFTIGGYVQRDRDGFGAGLGDRTVLRLAGMYAVGNGEVHLNWGRAGDYEAVPDSAANQFTVAYNHKLSKRTKVYGFWTKVDDKGSVYGDFSSLAVGIRHNF
jgi:predicted porin